MKKLPDGCVDITEKWRHGLGLTAGLLWGYLGKHGLVSVKRLEMDADEITAYELKQLFKSSGKTKSYVQEAIGWLACEGKIMMFENTVTGEESFCLNQTEQEIHRKLREHK